MEREPGRPVTPHSLRAGAERYNSLPPNSGGLRRASADLLAETVWFAELVGILQETVTARGDGAILQVTPRYQRLFARARPVIRGFGGAGTRVPADSTFRDRM